MSKEGYARVAAQEDGEAELPAGAMPRWANSRRSGNVISLSALASSKGDGGVTPRPTAPSASSTPMSSSRRDATRGGRNSTLEIIAGNGTSFPLFRRFNYGKAATLTFSDGSTESVTLKPIPLAQKVEFRARQTESIRITFDEVVRGSDAEYNDLCVSEMQALP